MRVTNSNIQQEKTMLNLAVGVSVAVAVGVGSGLLG